jgi:hypothetical protein
MTPNILRILDIDRYTRGEQALFWGMTHADTKATRPGAVRRFRRHGAYQIANELASV